MFVCFSLVVTSLLILLLCYLSFQFLFHLWVFLSSCSYFISWAIWSDCCLPFLLFLGVSLVPTYSLHFSCYWLCSFPFIFCRTLAYFFLLLPHLWKKSCLFFHVFAVIVVFCYLPVIWWMENLGWVPLHLPTCWNLVLHEELAVGYFLFSYLSAYGLGCTQWSGGERSWRENMAGLGILSPHLQLPPPVFWNSWGAEVLPGLANSGIRKDTLGKRIQYKNQWLEGLLFIEYIE